MRTSTAWQLQLASRKSRLLILFNLLALLTTLALAWFLYSKSLSCGTTGAGQRLRPDDAGRSRARGRVGRSPAQKRNPPDSLTPVHQDGLTKTDDDPTHDHRPRRDRRPVHSLEAAWNAGDGDAFAAPFAADADFVNVRAEHHRGRQAIAAGHTAIFRSIYAGSTNQYIVEIGTAADRRRGAGARRRRARRAVRAAGRTAAGALLDGARETGIRMGGRVVPQHAGTGGRRAHVAALRNHRRTLFHGRDLVAGQRRARARVPALKSGLHKQRRTDWRATAIASGTGAIHRRPQRQQLLEYDRHPRLQPLGVRENLGLGNSVGEEPAADEHRARRGRIRNLHQPFDRLSTGEVRCRRVSAQSGCSRRCATASPSGTPATATPAAAGTRRSRPAPGSARPRGCRPRPAPWRSNRRPARIESRPPLTGLTADVTAIVICGSRRPP